MIQSFEIPGRFLGRNESEKLARAHWSKANEVKREETEAAMLHAKAAGLKPADGPVDVTVVFCEQVRFFKNGKRKKPRDVDNCYAGLKPVLDGLVRAGVIPDDGPDNVRRVIPSVRYVEGDPHITVMVADYSPELTVTYPPVEVPNHG